MEKVPKREKRVLRGHQGAIYSIRWNEQGNYCMTCGQDRTIRLWNPHREGLEESSDEGLLIKQYSGRHGYDVQDVAIATDNATFSSCGSDRTVFMWDVSTGKIIRKFTGHEQRINTIKYNKDCSVLFSASYDKTVRAWDIRARSSYEPIQILDQFKDSVTSLEISDHEIIAGSVDGHVRVFDLRAGELREDNLHESITSIKLSNDSNCILASCLDSSLKLIEKSSGMLLSEYRGHKCSSFALGCAFSNYDAYVFSGSEDGKVYAWDLVEERIVHTISAHREPVSSIAYHKDQAMLLTASYDGLAKVYVA